MLYGVVVRGEVVGGRQHKHLLMPREAPRARTGGSPAIANGQASVTCEGSSSLWDGKSQEPLPSSSQEQVSPCLRCRLCLLALSLSTETHFLGSREEFGCVPCPWGPSPAPPEPNLMGPAEPESSGSFVC